MTDRPATRKGPRDQWGDFVASEHDPYSRDRAIELELTRKVAWLEFQVFLIAPVVGILVVAMMIYAWHIPHNAGDIKALRVQDRDLVERIERLERR
jgi:hypothetical protein